MRGNFSRQGFVNHARRALNPEAAPQSAVTLAPIAPTIGVFHSGHLIHEPPQCATALITADDFAHMEKRRLVPNDEIDKLK